MKTWVRLRPKISTTLTKNGVDADKFRKGKLKIQQQKATASRSKASCAASEKPNNAIKSSGCSEEDDDPIILSCNSDMINSKDQLCTYCDELLQLQLNQELIDLGVELEVVSVPNPPKSNHWCCKPHTYATIL